MFPCSEILKLRSKTRSFEKLQEVRSLLHGLFLVEESFNGMVFFLGCEGPWLVLNIWD